MTQGDLPDEMMQQLNQAQLGQILANAIAAIIKNRSSKVRKIYTGGFKELKMHLNVARSREIYTI